MNGEGRSSLNPLAILTIWVKLTGSIILLFAVFGVLVVIVGFSAHSMVKLFVFGWDAVTSLVG